MLWAQKPYLNRSSARQTTTATTASIELPATEVHSKECISTTRRNIGIKPIFTEGKLNNSSLRLGITRKASRRKKLWILKLEVSQTVQLLVSALRSGFKPNHEAAQAKLNYGLQEGCFVDPTSQES